MARVGRAHDGHALPDDARRAALGVRLRCRSADACGRRLSSAHLQRRLSRDGGRGADHGALRPQLRLDSASGATVGYVTSSGSLAFSGRTMTVSDGFTGTGRIILNSTQGGVFCMPNTSGTMKAIIINNATVTVRAPEGGECTQ